MNELELFFCEPKANTETEDELTLFESPTATQKEVKKPWRGIDLNDTGDTETDSSMDRESGDAEKGTPVTVTWFGKTVRLEIALNPKWCMQPLTQKQMTFFDDEADVPTQREDEAVSQPKKSEVVEEDVFLTGCERVGKIKPIENILLSVRETRKSRFSMVARENEETNRMVILRGPFSKYDARRFEAVCQVVGGLDLLPFRPFFPGNFKISGSQFYALFASPFTVPFDNWQGQNAIDPNGKDCTVYTPESRGVKDYTMFILEHSKTFIKKHSFALMKAMMWLAILQIKNRRLDNVLLIGNELRLVDFDEFTNKPTRAIPQGETSYDFFLTESLADAVGRLVAAGKIPQDELEGKVSQLEKTFKRAFEKNKERLAKELEDMESLLGIGGDLTRQEAKEKIHVSKMGESLRKCWINTDILLETYDFLYGNVHATETAQDHLPMEVQEDPKKRPLDESKKAEKRAKKARQDPRKAAFLAVLDRTVQ